VIFSDVERLVLFLRLRASLGAQMYYLPENQGRQVILRCLVEPFYGRGAAAELSPEWLRCRRDEELHSFLERKYHLGDNSLLSLLFNMDLQHQRCTPETERSLVLALRKKGLVAGSISIAPYKTGTNYFVRSGTKVVPLARLLPGVERELSDLAAPNCGTHVFSAELKELRRRQRRP
jgi:hypothetical protein